MNEGLHYYVMGRLVPVETVAINQQYANDYMAEHPNASLLHVLPDGLCVIADKNDRGRPIKNTPEKVTALADLRSLLESLHGGSEATGRWLDADGTECEEDDEGATWEEYTEEEQRQWLDTVAEDAKRALELLAILEKD
jgi:hypothetical protein